MLKNYFDLAGNVIAQIVVPFDKDLKPIESKKQITQMECDQLNRIVKIIQPNQRIYGV
jgi:hypothetical protein